MTRDREPPSKTGQPALIERRVRRIANARSATFGLALTVVVLAVLGAIVMNAVDKQNFPSLGLAVWWALQTITTVGYGDAVPTSAAGRVVGGIEMVMGVSFIALLTAGVTSTIIQRERAETAAAHRLQGERNTQTILEELAETRAAIAALEKRLDQTE